MLSVGLVLWCCRKMRPVSRPARGYQRSYERAMPSLQKFAEHSYTRIVTMSAVKTVGELAERMRSAGPPSEDDVTILLDGRRIDSKEAAEQWLAEVDAIRTSRAALNDPNK